MWSTFAGPPTKPVKVRFTEIIVRVSSKTTVATPVAVLELGGTSFEPVSVVVNVWLALAATANRRTVIAKPRSERCFAIYGVPPGIQFTSGTAGRKAVPDN